LSSPSAGSRWSDDRPVELEAIEIGVYQQRPAFGDGW
jgi:hypothetical protein